MKREKVFSVVFIDDLAVDARRMIAALKRAEREYERELAARVCVPVETKAQSVSG